MFEYLHGKPGFWSKTGPNADVAFSTRIRLARNLASVSFPHMQEEGEVVVIKSIASRFVADSVYGKSLSLVDVASLDNNDKRFLRERNIITPEMELSSSSFVIMDGNDDFTILVNEEDHFRIQVISPGFQVMETYRVADAVDDELNRMVSYAYSDDLGYLTTCASNLGTGLRVSAMLHLPALTMMRSIGDVTRVVHDYGAELKGGAGSDGKTIGNMYQVSNKISLGKSEIDILEEFDEVASMLIQMENEARDDYIAQYGRQLEDRICRSYGLIAYSRILNYVDAMENLSNIRLGVVLSIIKNIELHKINDLMINVQCSHLQKSAQRVFSDELECDSYRAGFLRAQFS